MTTDDLLDFSEAAAVLGVSAEKVRRLVVEDRSISTVRVGADGDRYIVDLDSLRLGNWRIDDEGTLLIGLPVFEQHRTAGVLPTMVGMTYKALDKQGGLRIERAELERYRDALPPGLVVAEPSDISPSAATLQTVAAVPPGLDPVAIATAFAGCWGTERMWRDRLVGLSRSSWMNTAPVVVRRGLRGRGPDGKSMSTIRDPIELAKGIVSHSNCDPTSMSRQFRTSIELRPWKVLWEDYAGWGSA